jgi:hypothetical protein
MLFVPAPVAVWSEVKVLATGDWHSEFESHFGHGYLSLSLYVELF